MIFTLMSPVVMAQAAETEEAEQLYAEDFGVYSLTFSGMPTGKDVCLRVDNTDYAQVSMNMSDSYVLYLSGEDHVLTVNGNEYKVTWNSGTSGFSVSDPSTVWLGTYDISWYDASATTFEIKTAAQLAGVAYLVNSWTTHFLGTTIHLTDDIYLNDTLKVDVTQGIYTDADANQWTTIGGNSTLSGDVTKYSWFSGTFEGNGHTIHNLYFKGGSDDSWSNVGLFGILNSGAVVRSLGVTGYIYAYRSIGGIAGKTYHDAQTGYTEGAEGDAPLIENCVNACTIFDDNGKNGAGGIIGSLWNGGTVRNCINLGFITSNYSQARLGGIAADVESNCSVENCYNLGSVVTPNPSDPYAGGIICNLRSGGVVSNSYTLAGAATNGGVAYIEGPGYVNGTYYTAADRTAAQGEGVLTAEQLKDSAFLTTINTQGNIFVADADSVNDGYPVLYWQSSVYRDKTVTVSVAAAANGAVSSDYTGSVAYGTRITLSNTPAQGYTLDYYTVNGQPIEGDYYYAFEDMTVSAVFTELVARTIYIPTDSLYTMTVTKNGVQEIDGTFQSVTDYEVQNGDTVYKNDELTVTVTVDTGVTLSDQTMEYSRTATVTAANTTTKLDNKVYVVSGTGDVTLTATVATQLKTWVTLADSSWYDDSSDTFTLDNAAQLAGVAELVNDENVTFEGKTILLGNDISLTNTDGTTATRYWQTIGTTAYQFRGTFDGQGYKITDFYTISGSSYKGLFYTVEDALIKNVTIASGNIQGNSNAAAIAYRADGDSVIENCVNNVTVTGTGGYVGGIVAYLGDSASVIDCVNLGSVTGAYYVGGIVGYCRSTGTVTNCRNEGDISAPYHAGGMIGSVASVGTGVRVTGCVNSGEISGSYELGGIVGGMPTGAVAQIAESENSGEIIGATYSCGGIVGSLAGGSVTDSSNSAAVTGTYYQGGIAGYAQNAALTDCVNSGSVRGSYSVGGILGYGADACGDVGGCTNSGAVSGSYHLGGVVGRYAGTGTVLRCTNNGDIVSAGVSTSTSYGVGGIVGYLYSGTVNRSSNNGDVTSSYISVGGVVGRMAGESAAVKNSYNTGAVASSHASALVGGIVGNHYTGTAVANCFSIGQVTSGYRAGGVIGQGATSVGNVTNNYYLQGTASGGINSQDVTGRAEAVDASELASADFAKKLGGAYMSGENGHPVLSENDEEDAPEAPETCTVTVTTYPKRADVTVKDSSGKEIAANEDGTYSLADGTYTYTATMPGYSAATGSFTVENGELKGLETITLTADVNLSVFTDVNTSLWYKNAVEYSVANNLFTGTSATTWEPDTALTRAMFVTVLGKYEGVSNTDYTTCEFNDVADGLWYTGYVQWAYNEGLVAGTGGGNFSPNDSITRQEMAVIFYKYAASKSCDMTASGSAWSGFSDKDTTDSWAVTALTWATDRGIINGSDDGKLMPKDTATRAQAAQIFMRIIEDIL